MSADNGIYILKTVDPKNPRNKEYRVKHLQAVENYAYDEKGNEYTDDENLQIRNAREMWTDCKIYKTEESAFKEAKRLYDEIMKSCCPICEYGISTIEIKRVF